jgi:hypothetical protein
LYVFVFICQAANTCPDLPSEQERLILTKIRMLPPEKIAEVADFVDFLSQKDQERQLRLAAGKMAEDTFKNVWDNSEDDAYDRL